MRDLRAAAAVDATMMPVAIGRLRGACDATLSSVMALIGIMRGIESLGRPGCPRPAWQHSRALLVP
jgi:hypothetical protein